MPPTSGVFSNGRQIFPGIQLRISGHNYKTNTFNHSLEYNNLNYRSNSRLYLDNISTRYPVVSDPALSSQDSNFASSPNCSVNMTRVGSFESFNAKSFRGLLLKFTTDEKPPSRDGSSELKIEYDMIHQSRDACRYYKEVVSTDGIRMYPLNSTFEPTCGYVMCTFENKYDPGNETGSKAGKNRMIKVYIVESSSDKHAENCNDSGLSFLRYTAQDFDTDLVAVHDTPTGMIKIPGILCDVSPVFKQVSAKVSCASYYVYDNLFCVVDPFRI